MMVKNPELCVVTEDSLRSIKMGIFFFETRMILKIDVCVVCILLMFKNFKKSHCAGGIVTLCSHFGEQSDSSPGANFTPVFTHEK